MKYTISFLLFLTLLGITLSFPEEILRKESSDTKATEEEITEEEEEKRPYSFAWKASRYYNGAPDREHIEERDENGVTRGVFRYVDPRQQIQEVVYHSDDTGFHVDASNLPQDTPVVSAARESHLKLFEKIKKDHERLAKEQEDAKEEEEEE